jgi:hypothetical protein
MPPDPPTPSRWRSSRPRRSPPQARRLTGQAEGRAPTAPAVSTSRSRPRRRPARRQGPSEPPSTAPPQPPRPPRSARHIRGRAPDPAGSGPPPPMRAGRRSQPVSAGSWPRGPSPQLRRSRRRRPGWRPESPTWPSRTGERPVPPAAGRRWRIPRGTPRRSGSGPFVPPCRKDDTLHADREESHPGGRGSSEAQQRQALMTAAAIAVMSWVGHGITGTIEASGVGRVGVGTLTGARATEWHSHGTPHWVATTAEGSRWPYGFRSTGC